MVVLNEICEKCNYTCNKIHYQQNFKNWTSGNDGIDKFIQDIQLSAHNDALKALEWIPYNRFYDIKYIAKGKFDEMYKAIWIDGYIQYWDNENQNWKRNNQNMIVNLKNLNNSKDIALEFINNEV